MPERELAFGLRQIPDDVVTCWGARLIWPADLVWDRQDMIGDEADRGRLSEWLNRGALTVALGEAQRLADGLQLKSSDDRMVTLLDNDYGTIVANPQGSHGYLYVAAWMKD